MMRNALLGIAAVLFVLAGSAAAQTCVNFAACVDGNDWVKIENGALTIRHGSYDPIGQHSGCIEALKGIILLNGVKHTISIQPDNTYLIDGAPFILTDIKNLDSYYIVHARGNVYFDGPYTVNIDDNGPGGSSEYDVNFCGQPRILPAPEFPAAPAMLAGLFAVCASALIAFSRKKE